MSLSPIQRMNTKKPLVSKPYKEFGIIEHEDIYIDNMVKGGKYTSHGRLIQTKQQDNDNRKNGN